MLYYQRMTPTKEDIKKWLKVSGKSREWLAEQCGVNKRQVDNWLSAARPVPSKAILIIQRLMAEKTSPISPQVELEFTDEEWGVISAAMTETQQTFMEFLNSAFQNAVKEFAAHALKRDVKKPTTRKQFPPVEPLPAVAPMGNQSYNLPIIGNIAAGGLQPGDTIPYHVRASRPLGKDEYVLRVEGKSMEPTIKDGALVIMRKHTIPPIPKVETIVQYDDERGVTLKKLMRRKNQETGKMEYVLHPLNPAFGVIIPMDGGKISGVYVETLEKWEKA